MQKLGIGGVDDHLTGKRTSIPFDPSRTRVSDESFDILDAIMPIIDSLRSLVPEIGVMTEADLRIKMANDRGFAAIILVLHKNQKEIAQIRGQLQGLLQREGLNGPIG